MARLNNMQYAKGKYNLLAIGKELGLNSKETMEFFHLYTSMFSHYMLGKNINQEKLDEFEELVLENVDNPEDFLFTNCPYQPSRPGKKKQNPVKYISVTEYRDSKLNYKVPTKVKVYVKDEFDLIKVLTDNKQVFKDYSNQSYKVVDEVLILYQGEKACYINPTIDLSQKYYYLENNDFKLEVGKTYVTSSNNEVIILSKDPENENVMLAITLGNSRIYEYSQKTKEELTNSNGRILGEKL